MTFCVNQDGHYLGDLDSLPEGAVEVSDPPLDVRQIWNGEVWGDIPDDRSIRQKRKDDYIAEISEEGRFEETVGDTLDAILKFLAKKHPDIETDPDTAPLITKIAEIKARYPH